MNILIKKIKLVQWKQLLVILVFAAFIIQNKGFAQKNVITYTGPDSIYKLDLNPLTIKLDSLTFKNDSLSLLKKIVQLIKFRENRNNRAKDSIYHFMLNRIQNGELKIDPKTVDQIMIQFEQIISANNVKNNQIDSDLNASYSANQANKKRIEEMFETYNLQDLATQSVIESLKTQMSSVIQENATLENQDKRELMSDINKELIEIRKVQYSSASKKASLDTLKNDTAMVTIKRSLKPKIKIIGWHNEWIKDEYINYNYNYLSAVNLYGYELAESGEPKNRGYLNEFEKTGGVIKTAQNDSCDVLLTVYNKYPTVITKFLQNSVAQDILLRELDSLIKKNKLKGINIYFEGINASDELPFVLFITKLYNKLKGIDETMQLFITIPAVSGDASKTEINAYNFNELNPMVNYYLVLTDRIIDSSVGISQSASPLFNSTRFGNRSVESTISYYSPLKIPINKLIMSVSYSGIEWNVLNFSGTLKSKRIIDIKYSDILKKYTTNHTNGQKITEGFDPDQAAPYLNVEQNPTNLKQIWFEDSRSLYLKYSWALDYGLGGVSIRGLGYDDGYSEFWNVLGATLIKIDTLRVDSISLKQPIQEKKVRFPILTSAWKGFKFKTFKQDLKWATVVRLKFDCEYTDTAGCKQTFCRVADIDSCENANSIKEYKTKEIIWTDTTMYVEDSKRYGEAFLKNKSNYFSLYTRWHIYADFFMWGGIILAILTAMIWLASVNSERYLLGTRSITRNMPSAFLLITLVFVSFWLYFDPHFTSFGAGSEEGTSTLILIYSIIAGITFGWFVTYRFFKYKSS